jgi:hypothetical protein
MTSVKTVTRKCYWAYIFIDKHREIGSFIMCTFSIFINFFGMGSTS